MSKYKNMQELANAFATGELDKTKYILILDNDSSYLDYVGPLPEGVDEDSDAADAWMEQKRNAALNMFDGSGYEDLLDACTAAGIPAEWV